MIYPFFGIYVLVGLAIGLLVSGWALRSGQFKEQQRARFLPLEDEPETAGGVTGASAYEIYVLWILAIVGILVSGAVLIFSFLRDGSY